MLKQQPVPEQHTFILNDRDALQHDVLFELADLVLHLDCRLLQHTPSWQSHCFVYHSSFFDLRLHEISVLGGHLANFLLLGFEVRKFG